MTTTEQGAGAAGPLSRDALLALAAQRQGLAFEDVPMPEWGGSVRVGEMSAGARIDYVAELSALSESDGPALYRTAKPLLLACTIIDGAGERIFPDVTSCTAWLRGVGTAAVDRLFEVARRLNAIEREHVEDLKGN